MGKLRYKTVLTLLALIAAISAHPAQAAAPAITPAQIEADWLRQDSVRNSGPAAQGKKVTPEQDAVGAFDGIKNGQWGFHTENEDNPWWQIDLGEATPLDRIVLYNRTELAGRNSRIIVLLSDNGKDFNQAYQHDGTTFLGHKDKKPLVVKLTSRTARYIRLQLPGKSYFHLDEVEVYSPGAEDNIAPGKTATQSSISQWSVAHTIAAASKSYPTAKVIERGLLLAKNLQQSGAKIDAQAKTLRSLAKQFAANASDEDQRKLYFQARWTVRTMALANPLLDFDRIVFAKRIPPAFPHMSDQYYGWWSRPGGGIYVLEGFKGESPRLRCLTEDFPEGSFVRPDLSHDGKKVLFAYCKFYPETHKMQKADKSKLPEDVFYKIYEMNLDGSPPEAERLTHGKYDDFDCRYLPDGDIVFLSTRKGQSVQCSRASAAATMDSDLPDSYVRCGGDNWRPVPVFTLHRIDGNGGNIRPISAFENFEWTPSVAVDGRILYARWDYIDRFNGPFMSLWSTNTNGTNPQLVYGNFTTRPQCVFEAVAIPNSQKLVFTAAAHHSNMGGSLVLLDRTRGTEYERPLRRLTPDACFPETEGWPKHYYANPYPLSEEFFLVAWSDKPLPPHSFVTTDERNPVNPLGIYLYDAFGNLELLHRDPNIASMYPLAVRPRRKPPTHPELVDWDGSQEGRFLVQDIYRGLRGIEPGSVKYLRIIGVPPKTQPHMNSPSLGVSKEDPGKFILGTVPVEEDGSAYFRVPSGIPLFFQALDENALAVQTMRTLTYVQPGQTLSCIGCHESRELAPPPTDRPLATLREPSRITPGPPGSWPLRFDRLVQPVLDKSCVSCHGPAGDNAKAVALDLTGAKAYQNLLSFADKDLEKLAFEKDVSKVGQCPAANSKLLAVLRSPGGHEGVQLAPDSFNRLVTWMDTYAQRLGSFSDAQEEQLRALRQEMAPLLAE